MSYDHNCINRQFPVGGMSIGQCPMDYLKIHCITVSIIIVFTTIYLFIYLHIYILHDNPFQITQIP